MKTEGRVSFTYTGRRASCSGTAVTSANKSTVITAGHCVKLDGAFHTDWVFVPAYNNGNAPYGTWTAKALKTTPQWFATEDLQYDVGGLASTLTGGASGGGWFASFNPTVGTGLLSSVNSYKIAPLGLPDDVPAIFGPTFGADVQNLYNAAQTA